MWVSYDPTPDADANSTTFIHGALVSWRYLQSDPSNVAFDIYKSVDGGQEVKLNSDALLNSTCFLDENIDVTKQIIIVLHYLEIVKLFVSVILRQRWLKLIIVKLH